MDDRSSAYPAQGTRRALVTLGFVATFLVFLATGMAVTGEPMPPPPASNATMLAAELPEPRMHPRAVWAGDAYYIFGGNVDPPGVLEFTHWSDDILRFDPKTSVVTTLPVKLPYQAREFSAVWTGTEVLLFYGKQGAGIGGSSQAVTGQIVSFNPATSAVTVLPTVLPPGTVGAATVWSGSVVYFFGGIGNCCGLIGGSLLGSGQALDTIMALDPATGILSNVGTMPAPRSHQSAIWTGDEIYLFGGYIYLPDSFPAPWTGQERLGSSDILRFELSTGSLTLLNAQVPSMPSHYGDQAIWDGENAYLFGAWTIAQFNPNSGTMSVLPVTTDGYVGMTAVAFDGCAVHLFGGGVEANPQNLTNPEDPEDLGTSRDDIERYGPVTAPVCPIPSPPGVSAASALGHQGLKGVPEPWPTQPDWVRIEKETGHDADGDGVDDRADNCPALPNHDQADFDHDGLGDACDDDPLSPADAATARRRLAFSDIDKDGIIDLSDNCPTIPNREQADLDLDGYGDVCDEDLEADGVLNAQDNCPTLANPRQEDRDLDGTGDACQLSPPAAGPRSTPVQPAASAPTPAVGLGLWLAPLWAALIAALLRLAQWLLGPAIIVLFSRLQKSSLLEHPVRDWILQKVTAQPGIHFRQLVRDSTSGRGALAHHLRVLRIAGLVREERVGKAVHYYLPSGARDAGAVKLRSLLRSELARCVASLVVATPGLPVPELATACGAKYGAVAYHLQRLAEAGAIEVRSVDGSRRVFPVSPELARLASG